MAGTDEQVRVGVIGGSGLYAMEELRDVREIRVSTPYGDPSDAITLGTLEGVRVAFLPRHGKGHPILPSEINARANIYALKSLGVEFLIAASAVGSMREEIEPTHMVVPDQIIDRTKGRPSTFFGGGIVGHIPFADPFCSQLSPLVADACAAAGATIHRGGTYLCMEGPQFSTRAESLLYRSWGVSIIGMTGLPEAKLAREAELCFATLALATDYDCWHDAHESVTAELVMKTVASNVATVRRALLALLKTIPYERSCGCRDALAHAIQTDPRFIAPRAVERLGVIYQKYAK
ncbi:MAG: S-methyl-5'-thioadenosine phosphorylase [Chloroflexota bacterium]